MARAVVSEQLAGACAGFRALKASLPPSTSVSAAERTALTHALHCPTCKPIADDLRRMHSAQTARLAAEAQEETEREAIPVLEQTADVLDANGFFRSFLWDTRQHAAGTPLELCRVDIAGALAIVLHGSPTYAGSPAVRKVEALLVDRIPAPSLAAWYSHPGVGGRQAVRLVRDTADDLRGLSTSQRSAA
jgi:hypothetical protein